MTSTWCHSHTGYNWNSALSCRTALLYLHCDCSFAVCFLCSLAVHLHPTAFSHMHFQYLSALHQGARPLVTKRVTVFIICSSLPTETIRSSACASLRKEVATHQLPLSLICEPPFWCVCVLVYLKARPSKDDWCLSPPFSSGFATRYGWVPLSGVCCSKTCPLSNIKSARVCPFKKPVLFFSNLLDHRLSTWLQSIYL